MKAPRADALTAELERDAALPLSPLRAARRLRRSRIKDRRIRIEHLMPMNVSGEHCVEVAWDRAAGKHVGAIAEREVHRTDRRSFDRLMKREQANVAARLELRKEIADPVPHARKSADRHLGALHVEMEGARVIEDVNARMHGEKRERN